MPEPRPRRKSAFNLALQEAQGIAPAVPQAALQHSDTATPLHSDAVEPSQESAALQKGHPAVAQLHSSTVEPSEGSTVSREDRATVQLFHSQTVSPPQGTTVIQRNRNTVLQGEGDTVQLSQGKTGIQHDSDTVKREWFTEKVTFYLTVEQVNKLDDLAHDYKKRKGKRINRNDIVRYLIDQCTLEGLEPM